MRARGLVAGVALFPWFALACAALVKGLPYFWTAFLNLSPLLALGAAIAAAAYLDRASIAHYSVACFFGGGCMVAAASLLWSDHGPWEKAGYAAVIMFMGIALSALEIARGRKEAKRERRRQTRRR